MVLNKLAKVLVARAYHHIPSRLLGLMADGGHDVISLKAFPRQHRDIHLFQCILYGLHLTMKVIWSLLPVGLVFRIKLMAESGALFIHGHCQSIHPIGGNERKESLEETEVGADVVALLVHDRLTDMGKVASVDDRVAVDEEDCLIPGKGFLLLFSLLLRYSPIFLLTLSLPFLLLAFYFHKLGIKIRFTKESVIHRQPPESVYHMQARQYL